MMMKASYLTLGIVTLLSICPLMTCASDGTNTEQKKQKGEIMESIFSQGVKAPETVFTGTVFVNMLVPDPDNKYDCHVYDVVFEAGARTNWHKHPGGQILLVTAGKGYYQERGKPVQLLHKGDVVQIPPDVEHWHGAASDSDFTHIGISPSVHKGGAAWLEPVSDAAYKGENMKNSEHKRTFTLSEKVSVEKVSYKNRYGIALAADMYLPKDMDRSRKHAAVIVGTPYGGVKEQGAGIYAQTMAEQGFVAIAFDESFNGESGGEPRRVSSPDIFVEDFSATVDFIGSRTFVDKNKIGVIGMCGSGGFAICAAQVDRRIKAVVTVSMYDMSRVKRYGFKDSMTEEERSKYLDELGEQRWKDFTSGELHMSYGTPNIIDANSDPISCEFYEYYRMPRGQHPNSTTGMSTTSDLPFMNFPLFTYIKDISPRPVLFVIGEHAHSRYFSDDTYKMAAEPKELYVVPGAGHVDLYDRTDMIPFDKLTAFFREHLK